MAESDSGEVSLAALSAHLGLNLVRLPKHSQGFTKIMVIVVYYRRPDDPSNTELCTIEVC